MLCIPPTPLFSSPEPKYSLDGGMKGYINNQGHMTKMAAMAINNKNLLKKKLLLQNQKTYDFETCQETSGGEALQNLYKSWPWDDLDLFYGKANIGCPCI